MTARERLARLGEILASDELPSPDAAPPRLQTRLIVSVAVAVLAGMFCGAMAARPGAVPDFLYPWTAARFYLDGQNPYDLMRGDPSQPPPFDTPFFYPFTTVIALLPFARMPLALACALFFGTASGLLAFAITRDGLWRLHVFASAPFVVAATLAQFSPLLMIMALVPTAGFLATVKPNLGLALLARRPTVRAAIGCAVFVSVSVLIFPSWVRDWLFNIRHEGTSRGVHDIPLLQTGGFVLLLALVAWRRAAGRLVLVLAAVPQALFFYDQLPLWLAPRTRRQSIALTACSQLGFVLWFLLRQGGESIVLSAYPYVLALVYLPALIIALR